MDRTVLAAFGLVVILSIGLIDNTDADPTYSSVEGRGEGGGSGGGVVDGAGGGSGGGAGSAEMGQNGPGQDSGLL